MGAAALRPSLACGSSLALPSPRAPLSVFEVREASILDDIGARKDST
jgi:hypothetical protein